MAKNNTRHFRMGCGEALCGALVRQQLRRPVEPRAAAPSAKPAPTPPTPGRSR